MQLAAAGCCKRRSASWGTRQPQAHPPFTLRPLLSPAHHPPSSEAHAGIHQNPAGALLPVSHMAHPFLSSFDSQSNQHVSPCLWPPPKHAQMLDRFRMSQLRLLSSCYSAGRDSQLCNPRWRASHGLLQLPDTFMLRQILSGICSVQLLFRMEARTPAAHGCA